ncbi:PIG-L family deacetylase [Rhodococcus sp. X156]|uniref:PIG-L family deacetylase n=1 Tax=Rhodococcus sp. X156 TaxID=2499145 RepID=UPI000FD6BC37|nr:PIG-L family deacetylase [Rhodococcus sp. X156]
MARTLVSFHAHPDDEVLLTGGTLARAAAEGHRVVLVVATNGEAGLAATHLRADGGLGTRRVAELERSAGALGCARLVLLGYRDSGWRDSATPGGFSDVDRASAARRVARVLEQERAEVLTTYDPAGGYGHPDHVQVHHVGALAARLAGTPRVLEATLDRRLVQRAVRLVEAVPGVLPGVRAAAFADAYSDVVTHRVDVRAHAAAKRAAMAAHASQATADSDQRTLALLLRLPRPVFRQALGREWFLQRDAAPGPLRDDVFAGLDRG